MNQQIPPADTSTPTPVVDGQIAWVLTINHRHGTNVHVLASSGDAVARAAEFAREWWDELDGADVPADPPVDDDEAVRIYFESHENEDYLIDNAIVGA